VTIRQRTYRSPQADAEDIQGDSTKNRWRQSGLTISPRAVVAHPPAGLKRHGGPFYDEQREGAAEPHVG